MTKAQSNQVATTDKTPPTLRERIDAAGPEFAKALPGHITKDKFVRTIQTAITMSPDIADAASQSRAGLQSLMTACTKAATDGLIIDGREAALVTFNTKVKKDGKDHWEKHVQYMPMVAGIMKMARNSGYISSIAAHVVHENDRFEYLLGDDERIDHAPPMTERGAPIAVYAIVKMKDGTVQREVMSKDEVLRIGAQGRNGAQYDPKSGKNYGEWWRKTVIRRISKYLPRSSDRDEFHSAVERIDDDYQFEATDGGTTVPANPTTKRRGAGAAKLKDITPAQAPQDQPQTADTTQHDDSPQDDQGGDWQQGFDPETGEVYGGQTIDGEAMQPGDDI